MPSPPPPGSGSVQTPPGLWQLKPWWCQPWSILLTGVAVVSLSWWGLHRWWLSLPVAVAVLLWWWLFLVMLPRAHAAGETAADPTAGLPPTPLDGR